MKRTRPALRAAIEAARQEQQILIYQAAALRELPPDSWVKRVSELEARIFALEALEATGQPSRS